MAERRRSVPNPIGRLVGSTVSGVVDAVDVDDIVQRIDVDGLVERVDIDALLSRLDVDALVARIDADALVSRVDADALIGRVDVDALVERVDANALLDRVDVNRVLDRVDADRLLDRVDANALLDRVDVNRLLDRVDVDAFLGRVDLDALMARVDLDAIVDGVDVDRIVQRADIAGIVAQSTRGITATTIDMVRRQLVGIDEIVTRVAARLVRRDPNTEPEGPPMLTVDDGSRSTARGGRSISGHYAGPLSRTAAFALDWFSLVIAFSLMTAAGTWMIGVLLGRDDVSIGPPWSTIFFVGWCLLYFAVPLAVAGRTLGKAVVGLRVVTRDGAPLRPVQALVRVVTMPLSFLLFGLGLVGTVFGRHKRALHDVVAGSCEVIDWADRRAELPTPLDAWLARRQAHAAAAVPAD